MNNPESVGFVLFVNNRTGMMQGPLLLPLSAPTLFADSNVAFLYSLHSFFPTLPCEEAI